VVILGQSRIDFESLSAVLKNRTRRRIITELASKGSISYVDLMNLINVNNTGKFNYHLKVLGDLIFKDESGKYNLSEKGNLSVKFLQNFNGEENSKLLMLNGDTAFKTRAVSIFPSLIWLLLVYPFLGILFGWYLFFSGSVLSFANDWVFQYGILSFIGLSVFVLFTLAAFPTIEINSDGITVKWGFSKKYFCLDEASVDFEGHMIKLGENRNTFGWYIPVKEQKLMNIVDHQVKEFSSKPLFLFFLIPQAFFGILFIGTKAPYELLSPELWAILWGITTTISISLFTYASKLELRIGKIQRGLSAALFGILIGAIIALIILLI